MVLNSKTGQTLAALGELKIEALAAVEKRLLVLFDSGSWDEEEAALRKPYFYLLGMQAGKPEEKGDAGTAAPKVDQ